MVVHNGGRLTKGFEKFDKFGIGYREEDKQLYLEYQDIVKMYDPPQLWISWKILLEKNHYNYFGFITRISAVNHNGLLLFSYQNFRLE